MNTLANTEVKKTKNTDLMLVDPRNLVVEEGFNVRIDYGDIRSLAISLVQHGVEEPLICFKKRGADQYVVTDGHRRERALKYAIEANKKGEFDFADLSKITFVPVRLASADPMERLYTVAITGEMKKNLNDLERATLYSRLIDMLCEKKKIKRTEALREVMENVQVSQATMYNILKLNTLPEEIKDAINNGEISGSTVTTIVREIKDEGEAITAIKDAIATAKRDVKNGVTKRATASHVKGLKAKSVVQRLKEVQEKLEAKEVKNSRTKLLADLLDALENKKSVNKIIELFM